MSDTQRITIRVLVYGALIIWTFISLFPIYWTVTTSFKVAKDVQKGAIVPWVGYQPNWLGWRSLGLSPDTLFAPSTVRDEFLIQQLAGGEVVHPQPLFGRRLRVIDHRQRARLLDRACLHRA